METFSRSVQNGFIDDTNTWSDPSYPDQISLGAPRSYEIEDVLQIRQSRAFGIAAAFKRGI